MRVWFSSREQRNAQCGLIRPSRGTILWSDERGSVSRETMICMLTKCPLRNFRKIPGCYVTFYVSLQKSSSEQEKVKGDDNEAEAVNLIDHKPAIEIQSDEESKNCERTDTNSLKTSSSPGLPNQFTDTDPATGLVRNVKAVLSQKADKANILTGRPTREMPGHTGYLTFATLYPRNAGDKLENSAT